mmetsp:Transcript_63250/g.100418  ORF Transcript_63250/g.100418 Transcript_63250/m.100418 type:complete len:364 (-) Transcript_63250:82-1173(-)
MSSTLKSATWSAATGSMSWKEMWPVQSGSSWRHRVKRQPLNPISSQARTNCFSPILRCSSGSMTNQSRSGFPNLRQTKLRKSLCACTPRRSAEACRGDDSTSASFRGEPLGSPRGRRRDSAAAREPTKPAARLTLASISSKVLSKGFSGSIPSCWAWIHSFVASALRTKPACFKAKKHAPRAHLAKFASAALHVSCSSSNSCNKGTDFSATQALLLQGRVPNGKSPPSSGSLGSGLRSFWAVLGSSTSQTPVGKRCSPLANFSSSGALFCAATTVRPSVSRSSNQDKGKARGSFRGRGRGRLGGTGVCAELGFKMHESWRYFGTGPAGSSCWLSALSAFSARAARRSLALLALRCLTIFSASW